MTLKGQEHDHQLFVQQRFREGLDEATTVRGIGFSTGNVIFLDEEDGAFEIGKNDCSLLVKHLHK